MMERYGSDFLRDIAEEFLSRRGSDINRYAFVFPNRRSGIYFRKILGELSQKPLLSPDVFSVRDFSAYCSGINILENFELIFELYRVYRTVVTENVMAFEDFFPMGKIILEDFNEIDKSLADTGKIFRELKSFKETGFEGGDRFSGLWEMLENIYGEFRSNLRMRNRGYDGMTLKIIAEEPDLIWEKNWEKIFFVGFNALSGAEKKLISDLIKSGKGEIYFEMDSYFMDDEDQEAGKFLREYRDSGIFGPSMGKMENLLAGEVPKTVRILNTSTRAGQAKIIGKFLKEENWENREPEDVAVILPDETLLFPILNSLPETLKKGNISLGFPLSNTSVFSLIRSVIKIHGNSTEGIYGDDVTELLSHPYMSILFPEESLRITEEISGSGGTPIKEIRSRDDLLESIFTLKSGTVELIDLIGLVLERVYELYRKDENILPEIEMEIVFYFYDLILKLREVITSTGVVPGIKGFDRLFSELSNSSHIPFTGEPLEGIQILGLLESRNLKFSRVFIPSVNEGTFPKSSSKQTFIPVDVRIENGLPTENSTDSIFAYIFYRILKNSEDITLIYTNETTGNSKGEKSRFINQLLLEYAGKAPNVNIVNKTVVFPFESPGNRYVEIVKRAGHIEILKKIRFSATSLKTYLMCPLKFYFRYILRLKEDDREDPQDPSVYGALLHEVLEEIFGDATGKIVEESYLDRFTPEVTEKIIKSVFKRKNIAEPEAGKARISFEVIKKFIGEFLKKEKEEIPFKIVDIEKELSVSDNIFSETKDIHSIGFTGRIDRMDEKDGITRIIDYKSGRLGKLKARELFNSAKTEEWNKIPEIFQLFFYAYLLKRSGELPEKFRLGIYPFKNFYGKLEFVTLGKEEVFTPGDVEEFEKELFLIVSEIFNTKIPFTQTDELKSCGFCPYSNICEREKTGKN